MKYKNVWISFNNDRGSVHYDEAEVFGVSISGFLSVKTGGSWKNFNLDHVLGYGCDIQEDDQTEFDLSNVTRLQ